MYDSKFATHFTRWANRALMVIMVALAATLPLLLNWYTGFRDLSGRQWWAICITFYCCAAVTAPALWFIDRLLGNILQQQVFTWQNVSLLRRIRWCCGGVCLLCVAPSFVYIPLVFLFMIMGFLCLAVSVLVQVMKAAVAIREENDLTI